MSVSDNETLQRDKQRAFFRRIMIYIGVIIAIIVIGAFLFHQFKVYSNARLRLREAKNIKISLEMIDTEYYAFGLSVYDDTADRNIRNGVCDHVEKLQGKLEGTIKLTGYDLTNRQITGFEYETEDYIVRYEKNDIENIWTVCLIKELLKY